MELMIDFQNRLKSSGFWIFGAFMTIYFVFHAINGERGFLKYMYLHHEIEEAKKVAEKYSLEKTRLEEKIQHLSNRSLDLDLLEERARIILNLAADDEFIILDE